MPKSRTKLSDCSIKLMVLKLALLGGLIGLTLVLCGPIRFPGVKMLFSMAIATGLVSLAYYDIVFIIIVCVIPLLGIVIMKSKAAIIPAILMTIVAVVTYLTPHAEDLLYLDLRYSDNFTYVEEGVYHAEYLKRDIRVDKRIGDDYQSYFYEPQAIAITKSRLPPGTVVFSADMDIQQTRYLATTFAEFMNAEKPVIHLVLSLPEDKELDRSRLPFKTIIELR